jgi:hypothetical protein
MKLSLMIRPAIAFVLTASALWSAAEAKEVPICSEWDLTGKWYINQTNGFDVIFQIVQTGTQLSGDAWYYAKNNSDGRHGSLEGHLNGDLFVIVAHWDGAGAGEYSGYITPKGLIAGNTTDLSNTSSRARWSGDYRYPAKYKVAAAAPAPAAPSKPLNKLGKRPILAKLGQKTVNVINDVEVYDAPNGQGNKIGELKAPNTVKLAEACQNNWCHVLGPAVPTGNGWVYDGPDYDSLQ